NTPTPPIYTLSLHDALPIFLISSHILTELAEICTGAIFIERGKVLRSGTLEQLLAEGLGQRTVVVRTLGPLEGLLAHLLSQPDRSEEHTSELQSRENLVCRL